MSDDGTPDGRNEARLSGETIIYFGPEPWEGMWRNRHQLMTRLARENRVVYAEPPAMLRPAIRRLLGARGDAPEAGGTGRVRQDDTGVLVYESPSWTPLTGRAPFRDPALRLYFAVLKRRCGIERSCRPIVWLSRPPMSDYIGRVGEKLAIYHVVDEYTAYTGVDEATREWLVSHEREAMRASDAVIVVTRALYDAKRPYNDNCYLVPNAVDFEAYSNPDTPEPDDLRDIARPVIGFTGLVSARLDFALLTEAADARPDWSFVFVGAIDRAGCEAALDRLDARPNVHLLGVRPVTAMPAYLQRFDVCTIPYAADDSAENASPLKLYEYAAVSRPIVTTDFPAAREFPGHLERVSDAAAFVAACERALSLDRNATELEENRAYAAENTWDERVRAISEIMIERMAAREKA